MSERVGELARKISDARVNGHSLRKFAAINEAFSQRTDGEEQRFDEYLCFLKFRERFFASVTSRGAVK